MIFTKKIQLTRPQRDNTGREITSFRLMYEKPGTRRKYGRPRKIELVDAKEVLEWTGMRNCRLKVKVEVSGLHRVSWLLSDCTSI